MLIEHTGTYLQGLRIGTLGENMFLGMLPEQPDFCVALFQYAGETPNLVMSETGFLERPGLQIQVRSPSYLEAESVAYNIFDELNGLSDIVLPEIKDGTESENENGIRYLLFLATQSPSFIGRDENNRSMFAVNFIVIREGGS